MKRIIMLAMLTTTATARAQWPTNWPGGDYDGRERALCVYSALVERALAAGVGTNELQPPGTFTQRRRLVSYKSFFRTNLATRFVVLAQTNATGQYSETNSDAIVNTYTATGMCVAAGVHTNYLTRTPMFNLGSDTNYGWVPFKALCNQAVWTTKRGWGTDTVTVTNDPPLWRSVNPESGTRSSSNLVGAYNYVLDDWTNQVTVYVDYEATAPTNRSWYQWTTNDVSSDLYNIGAQSWDDAVPATNIYFKRTGGLAQTRTNVWSGAAHAADVLGFAETTAGSIPSDILTYSNLDAVAIVQSQLTVVASLAVATTNWRVMDRTNMIAYTNIIIEPVQYTPLPPIITGGFPEWNFPPFMANLTNQPVGSSAGMAINRPSWIFRWNVTNGFKYVP